MLGFKLRRFVSISFSWFHAPVIRFQIRLNINFTVSRLQGFLISKFLISLEESLFRFKSRFEVQLSAELVASR